MAELLLVPAGIPPAIYGPILRMRDESTGKTISKRQMAPLILDALENRGLADEAVRSIIRIAANWKKWELAGAGG